VLQGVLGARGGVPGDRDTNVLPEGLNSFAFGLNVNFLDDSDSFTPESDSAQELHWSFPTVVVRLFASVIASEFGEESVLPDVDVLELSGGVP